MTTTASVSSHEPPWAVASARLKRGEARALCDKDGIGKRSRFPCWSHFLTPTGCSLRPNKGPARKNALVGQEAFLVDAYERIAKYLVVARKAAGRASTVSKRAFSTVMNHRPGGSATKTSLGGAVLPPFPGVGELRPSQNCGRDRCYRSVFHRYTPSRSHDRWLSETWLDKQSRLAAPTCRLTFVMTLTMRIRPRETCPIVHTFWRSCSDRFNIRKSP
jgi:hypothetical protein